MRTKKNSGRLDPNEYADNVVQKAVKVVSGSSGDITRAGNAKNKNKERKKAEGRYAE